MVTRSLRLVLRIAPESDAREREAEILMLRHQLAVLKRKAGRPKLRRRDRMLLAAFSRLVPRERLSCFIVSPQTILRWHRELVRRKWTYRHARTGRPPLDPQLVVLIIQMARSTRPITRKGPMTSPYSTPIPAARRLEGK